MTFNIVGYAVLRVARIGDTSFIIRLRPLIIKYVDPNAPIPIVRATGSSFAFAPNNIAPNKRPSQAATNPAIIPSVITPCCIAAEFPTVFKANINPAISPSITVISPNVPINSGQVVFIFFMAYGIAAAANTSVSAAPATRHIPKRFLTPSLPTLLTLAAKLITYV